MRRHPSQAMYPHSGLDNLAEEEEEDAAESDDEAKHEVEGVETFICTSCD